jgi:hypothetical protein
MGVHTEVNHTTATQFEGWKNIIESFCTSYNNNPDAKCIVDPASVWQRARGYLGDHAADQKKLSSQLEAFPQECDRELRGEEALFSDDPQDEAERERLFHEKSEEMFERAGGKEHWTSLPPRERLRQEKAMIRETQIALGELVYQRLSPEEKAEVNFWVYTGCTMHKDLNAMKGGVEKMAKSWEQKKKTPSIPLMSKTQVTAAAAATAATTATTTPSTATITTSTTMTTTSTAMTAIPTAMTTTPTAMTATPTATTAMTTTVADSRLVPKKGKSGNLSERGGVKLTSLLGALVKHKNPKKGHQARFRVYCRKMLGVEIVEQAHSIFYILQVYSNLTLGEGRGEWLLGLLLVSEDGGREQETLYYYSVTWDHYIVII